MPVNHLVAARNEQLAHRLYAQELLAENQPGPALPLLHLSLLARKCNQPPVEEFLIAEALLALDKPDEAKRCYRAAIQWPDKAQIPMRMTNAVERNWPRRNTTRRKKENTNSFLCLFVFFGSKCESWFRARVEAKMK